MLIKCILIFNLIYLFIRIVFCLNLKYLNWKLKEFKVTSYRRINRMWEDRELRSYEKIIETRGMREPVLMIIW